MSDTKKMIEVAAKALGMRYSMADVCWYLSDGSSFVKSWNPADDQADNDRMGCDLEIECFFGNGLVFAKVPYTSVSIFGQHDNTIEGRRAAVRLARLQVAAEMGRMK